MNRWFTEITRNFFVWCYLAYHIWETTTSSWETKTEGIIRTLWWILCFYFVINVFKANGRAQEQQKRLECISLYSILVPIPIYLVFDIRILPTSHCHLLLPKHMNKWKDIDHSKVSHYHNFSSYVSEIGFTFIFCGRWRYFNAIISEYLWIII